LTGVERTTYRAESAVAASKANDFGWDNAILPIEARRLAIRLRIARGSVRPIAMPCQVTGGRVMMRDDGLLATGTY